MNFWHEDVIICRKNLGLVAGATAAFPDSIHLMGDISGLLNKRQGLLHLPALGADR